MKTTCAECNPKEIRKNVYIQIIRTDQLVILLSSFDRRSLDR